jgi:hypothetical protein
MTTNYRGESSTRSQLECGGASSPAWSDERPEMAVISKSESQLEVGFLGIHAKARGTVAIIVVALLVAMWMALSKFHMS